MYLAVKVLLATAIEEHGYKRAEKSKFEIQLIVYGSWPDGNFHRFPGRYRCRPSLTRP